MFSGLGKTPERYPTGALARKSAITSEVLCSGSMRTKISSPDHRSRWAAGVATPEQGAGLQQRPPSVFGHTDARRVDWKLRASVY